MTSPAAPRRALRADATALTVGSVVAGLTAYGFVVVGTRAVGAEAFAPVSVLWSLWAISAAAITFPVQHWIIRSVELNGHERDVWAAARVVWIGTLSLALMVVGGTMLVEETLFGTDGMAFPVMAACLPVGSVLVGFNRGMLAARSRFRATGFAIAGDNVLRLLVLLPLAPVVSAEMLGWILVAGFGVAALFPDTLLPRGRTSGVPSRVNLLGGMAGANAAAQAVLTSGPILVSVLGDDRAAVTSMFALLAVLRAPHTLVLGVTARAMAPLTRLAASGEGRLRTVERWLLLATGVVAIAGVVLGPVVIPVATEAVFSVGADVPGSAVALLTGGTVVALGGVIQMLLLLAEGRGRRLTVAWAASLCSGALVLMMPIDPPMVLVAAAFATAEVVAMAAMVGTRWTRTAPGGGGGRR